MKVGLEEELLPIRRPDDAAGQDGSVILSLERELRDAGLDHVGFRPGRIAQLTNEQHPVGRDVAADGDA